MPTFFIELKIKILKGNLHSSMESSGFQIFKVTCGMTIPQ